MNYEVETVEAGEYRLPVHHFGPGTSSMDVLWELIEAGECPVWGTTLMERQSAGRGRMGRSWQSPPGHVYGALRLPTEPPFDGPGASLALSVLLALALNEYGFPAGLKWPNDLILAEAKVGGLLLESRKDALIAGIGFNLGSPPEGDWLKERAAGAPPPGAIDWDGGPKALWAGLVKNAFLLYNKKFGSRSISHLLPEAERLLLWRGRTVKVDRPASEPLAPESGLTGRIVGLGPEGQLFLTTSAGSYQVWSGTLLLVE